MSHKSVLLIIALTATILVGTIRAKPLESNTIPDSDVEAKKVTILREAITANIEAYDGFIEGFAEALELESEPSVERMLKVFDPWTNLPNATVEKIRKHLTEYGELVGKVVIDGGTAPSADEAAQKYREIVDADIKEAIEVFRQEMETDTFFGSLERARGNLVVTVTNVMRGLVDFFQYLFKSYSEHPDDWKEFEKIKLVNEKTSDIELLSAKLQDVLVQNGLSESAKIRAQELLGEMKKFQSVLPMNQNSLASVFRDIIVKQMTQAILEERRKKLSSTPSSLLASE